MDLREAAEALGVHPARGTARPARLRDLLARAGRPPLAGQGPCA